MEARYDALPESLDQFPIYDAQPIHFDPCTRWALALAMRARIFKHSDTPFYKRESETAPNYFADDSDGSQRCFKDEKHSRGLIALAEQGSSKPEGY
jgi:hypothetical protein